MPLKKTCECRRRGTLQSGNRLVEKYSQDLWPYLRPSPLTCFLDPEDARWKVPFKPGESPRFTKKVANITKRGSRLCANHVSCERVPLRRLSNGRLVALRLADSTPLIGVSDAVGLPAITMYFQYIIGSSEAVFPHGSYVKRRRSRVYNNTQGKRTWEMFKSTALHTIHLVFFEAREKYHVNLTSSGRMT